MSLPECFTMLSELFEKIKQNLQIHFYFCVLAILHKWAELILYTIATVLAICKMQKPFCCQTLTTKGLIISIQNTFLIYAGTDTITVVLPLVTAAAL